MEREAGNTRSAAHPEMEREAGNTRSGAAGPRIMARTLGRVVIFLGIFFCTTGFDQASKEWAKTLPPGVRQPVIDGYWDWEYAKNPGVAFSTFTGGGITGQIVLSIIAAVALIGIGIAAARTRPEQKLKLAALALIGGGALGNLLDRVRDGAVTDFVRWRVHEHLWPIFNVADAALLVGVALLFIETALRRDRRAIMSA